MAEFLANELENIPEASLDTPCCRDARHFLRPLAEELRGAGSRGIPTDNAARLVIWKYETGSGRSGQPLRGEPLLPSDKETPRTHQAELEKLRRELALSNKSASKPESVKAAAAGVDVVPGSKPCPVCKLEGHRSAECLSNLFVAGTGGVVQKTFKCWFCDKHGHHAAQLVIQMLVL